MVKCQYEGCEKRASFGKEEGKSHYCDEHNYSVIDESTIIKSKKYKTIGDLKNAGLKAMIQTTTRMAPCIERDYLDNWLWDTHYSKMYMVGNLTTRITNISNTICYREVVKRCFNNIDIISNNTITKDIIPKASIDLITELHSISPSMLGTFIDYLVRRIISELTGKPFQDSRSNAFYKERHTCNKPIIDYTVLNVLELREHCRNMNTTRGYMLKGISKMNKKTLLDHLLEIQHSEGQCKLSIKYLNTCVLPICQYLCYKKARNTIDYKTKDVIVEIFITSLFHSEAFRQAPQQEDFNKMLERLTINNDVIDILLPSITLLCYDLIKDKSSIFLNPVLGGELDDIDDYIPADADLVIDDMLYDIKCTKSRHTFSEITQLLGYSSLIMLNKNFLKKINKISIINILAGNITTYNIDFINKDNCVNYIKVLTNSGKEPVAHGGAGL